MKKVLFTIYFALTCSLVLAQTKIKHVLMDLKATGGSISRIVSVKNKGVLFDIYNPKILSYDLVFYDMNMVKKWTYTISKTDLEGTSKLAMEASQDKLIYSNNRFIYVHVKVQNFTPKAYMVFCIDMDGNLVVKNSQPIEEESQYRTLVADNGNVYLFFTNGKTGDKQLYYLMEMNPKTAAFDEKIILKVPTLKSGEWNYAGNAGGKLFFYGFQDQSAKENKNNGLMLAFAPVTDEGDVVKPFALNIKLDQYFASNENVNAPLANVLIDTVTKAIYVYCHMTQRVTDNANNMPKCKGIYIQKFDLEGNPLWSKEYSNEDIAKYNVQASKEQLVSLYGSYLDIDDSTKNIILVRNEESVGTPYSKCFYFDENGNIKKILVGMDQSSRFEGRFARSGVSPFFTNVQYAQGDYSYFKSLQTIFSKYPPNQSRPMGLLINLGGKYWTAVMDEDKNTLDIYEL